MKDGIQRRNFMKAASAGFFVSTLANAAPARAAANDKFVVGVMGVNGRGGALARGFASLPDAEVAYVCDVDQRAIDKVVASVEGKQERKPAGVVDFHKVLDDKTVDVLVVATPDHWHAPATILGVNAGKHVYVEKPCSHNAAEGEMMIAAARKHNKVVQMGTQRRSWPLMIEMVERLRNGVIGNTYFSRSWYCNRRGSIGVGKPAEVPSWLDYSLWQGPAPEMAYHDNYLHYNWHWFWNWGTGELGNNGIHSLDISRWGLGVEYPSRVTAGGARLRYDDDQQTPDTHIVTFDYDDKKTITWEGTSWSPRGFEKSGWGIAFHGDAGTLVTDGNQYTIFDMHNKEVEKKTASEPSDGVHFANFLQCIRDSKRPNADIEIGHKSTLLCHLGNIAWRTGHTLTTDPTNGHIVDDAQAQALWGREYRPGWEPKV